MAILMMRCLILQADMPGIQPYWGNAWGLHLFQSDGWYPDENGQIQYEFISDRAKEFYTWLNGFMRKGSWILSF